MIEKVQPMLTAKYPFFILFAILNLTIGNVEAAKCEQNRTHVVCERRSSSNPLRSIKVFKEIDTIIVHNSKLDLTTDLFDSDKPLPSVSLVNMTGNGIERLGRRGFENIHNVEFLYLSQNLIAQAQPDPFMSLERLKTLEMNEALSGKSTEKEELLRNVFHSHNDFTELAEIQLNDNNISSLHQKTFCGVGGLRRLELSNNKLTTLDFARKCFRDLKALFISGNQISTIPKDIWDFMPSLSSFDISNNPIHCDCTIIELLKADDVSFINQGNTFCASPPDLKGKNVFELPSDFCTPSSGSTVFHFFVLTLVAVAVIYLYRNYRQRLSSFNSKTVVGYKNIEQTVEPEFV